MDPTLSGVPFDFLIFLSLREFNFWLSSVNSFYLLKVRTEDQWNLRKWFRLHLLYTVFHHFKLLIKKSKAIEIFHCFCQNWRWEVMCEVSEKFSVALCVGFLLFFWGQGGGGGGWEMVASCPKFTFPLGYFYNWELAHNDNRSGITVVTRFECLIV